MNRWKTLSAFALTVCAAVAGAGLTMTRAQAAVAVAAPPKTGACCMDDYTCQITTAKSCQRAGGTYLGNGSSCADCPPPPPATGACCVGDACLTLTADECASQNGTYFGDGSHCDVLPPLCVELPTGACCVPGLGGSFCVDDLNEFQCLIWGGEWQGADSTCTPDLCPLDPPPPGEEEM